MLKNPAALPAALMMLAALALAACHKAPSTPYAGQADTPTPTSAAPTMAATMDAQTSAPGGRLVLAVIAGHPGAAYIAWRNTGAAPATITGITIAGASRAEMHETRGGAMLPLPKVTLAPGEEAGFAPGGRHVMVYGLPASVKPGDKLPYTLLLADGSKLAGTLTAEEAGASSGQAMPGMKM